MNDDARRDEIASAVLDGEATPAERALAADDPAIAARIERLRRIRAAIADVPAPDAGRREQAIAAALGAAPGDAVTSLTVEREKRRVSPRTLRVASVAAAVAVGFLVISLIAVFAGSGGDDADGDFATGEVSTESDATSGDGAGAADESDMAAATGAEAPDTADGPGDGAATSEPREAAVPEAATADDDAAAGAPEETGAAAGQDPRVALEVILADAPDLGEADLARLVTLASPDGDDSPTGVGTTDEATVCVDEIEAALVGDAVTAIVATVDGMRVVAVGTPAGVVVIELVTCTVIDG